MDETNRELEFTKSKMIGRVTYRRELTTVKIVGSTALIDRHIKRIFRSEKVEQHTLELSQIITARVRTVVDFWDTLYGIIFALVGVVGMLLGLGVNSLLTLILSAICLWCGYGKRIEISCPTGKVEIPFKGEDAESKALLDWCNRKM